MTNPKLESILKKARLPETSEASLELFPHQVTARLKRGDLPGRVARRGMPRLAWAAGFAACILMAFILGHRSGRIESEMAGNTDSLASAKLVHETLALFPNQVRAITEDDHGLKLVLSTNRDVPSSPPIYVRICDGTHCASVVTFSGQEIQIAGRTLTVLADAHDGIILTGDRFVWSNMQQIYAGNRLKIEARNLGMTAM
jgi:hypothetical protein